MVRWLKKLKKTKTLCNSNLCTNTTSHFANPLLCTRAKQTPRGKHNEARHTYVTRRWLCHPTSCLGRKCTIFLGEGKRGGKRQRVLLCWAPSRTDRAEGASACLLQEDHDSFTALSSIYNLQPFSWAPNSTPPFPPRQPRPPSLRNRPPDLRHSGTPLYRRSMPLQGQ